MRINKFNCNFFKLQLSKICQSLAFLYHKIYSALLAEYATNCMQGAHEREVIFETSFVSFFLGCFAYMNISLLLLHCVCGRKCEHHRCKRGEDYRIQGPSQRSYSLLSPMGPSGTSCWYRSSRFSGPQSKLPPPASPHPDTRIIRFIDIGPLLMPKNP